MNQLEVLRESLGQCDEIILDALYEKPNCRGYYGIQGRTRSSGFAAGARS